MEEKEMTISTAAFSDSDSIQNSNVRSFPKELSRVSITEPDHNWRQSIIKRLEEITHLQPGWDGYVGKPVSFENANFSLRMLEAICLKDAPAPQIVPGSNGDLQIEWHTHTVEIELHVKAPNNVQAWIFDEGSPPDGFEISLTNDFSLIAKKIRLMTEPTRDIKTAAR